MIRIAKIPVERPAFETDPTTIGLDLVPPRKASASGAP